MTYRPHIDGRTLGPAYRGTLSYELSLSPHTEKSRLADIDANATNAANAASVAVSAIRAAYKSTEARYAAAAVVAAAAAAAVAEAAADAAEAAAATGAIDRPPARSSVGASVSPQGDAEAQQNDAQTLTHGATWTQRLRSRR
jgi:hypothetical protein